MTIDRVSKLSQERFVEDYLRPARPVVVTDALDSWPLSTRWTPAYLEEVLGEEIVLIFDELFDLQNMYTLSEYVQEYLGRDRSSTATDVVPYVRWYTQLKEEEFAWADDAMKKLAANWSTPYFIPRTDMVVPFAPAPKEADPLLHNFPGKALFISAKGAKTRLHFDPWHSDAFLCQVHGTKRWRMYSPDQGRFLRTGSEFANGAQFANPDAPDRATFPDFDRASPTYDLVLEPGETIYIPRGWFHHVQTVTDAISVTWNFVHRVSADDFVGYLERRPPDVEQSVVQYYLGRAVGGEATPAAVRSLLERTFGRPRDDAASGRARAT